MENNIPVFRYIWACGAARPYHLICDLWLLLHLSQPDEPASIVITFVDLFVGCVLEPDGLEAIFPAFAVEVHDDPRRPPVIIMVAVELGDEVVGLKADFAGPEVQECRRRSESNVVVKERSRSHFGLRRG